MSQFGRSFGSATPPTVRNVSFGTYRDSSLPRNEDTYSGFRTNKQHQERMSQEYSRTSAARRGLPFHGPEYSDLGDYGMEMPFVMDRSTGGKHRDDLIRNTLLEEIYSDFGMQEPSLDLFEMDNQYLMNHKSQIPDILGEMDQVIPFGKIGQAEEDLARQREQKQMNNSLMAVSQKTGPGNVRGISDYRDKGQNSPLTYTNLDPFSRKTSKPHDLNEAVASPTISSSCEPEKVLPHGGIPQLGSGGSLSESSVVHSTTNCAGSQIGSQEEGRGRDASGDREPSSRITKTSGSDGPLYPGGLSSRASPALSVYRDGRSQLHQAGSRIPLGYSREYEGRKAEGSYPEREFASRDAMLEGEIYSSRSPSVTGATKLEEALPSELDDVKSVSVASKYGQVEGPAIPTSGGESSATSSSTSPSQIHVAKKQRIINCASDLLEEVRECYAYTQGADLYAPAVHPTFSDQMAKTEAPQPYRFQPPSAGTRPSCIPTQRPLNFNFGATASGFCGSRVVPQYPPGSVSGVSYGMAGNDYCGYGVTRSSNMIQQSPYGNSWCDARQMMTSPGAFQSCPDLTSPENTPGSFNLYSSPQVGDGSRYGRPCPVQPGLNPNHAMRQAQPVAQVYDERDVLPLSPASQLRQQTLSAPSTPSKRAWGSGYPPDGVRLRNTPVGFRPVVSSQYLNMANASPMQNSSPHMTTAPVRGTNYLDHTPVRSASGINYGGDQLRNSRPASPYHATPQMQPQQARSGLAQKSFANSRVESPYSFVAPDLMSHDQQDVPLAQQRFMQQLIHDDSTAFRSHPLFPLMRDLIIADMNFHTPTFPFQLIANLPTDFGRLLHNYIVRNPGVNLDQGDPSVHSVFMDGLKFAHSTLIGKIQTRKLKEGYQDCIQPTANVEDMCESFARSVKPSLSKYGVDDSVNRGSLVGQRGPAPAYSCPQSLPGIQSTPGVEPSVYSVQQQMPSSEFVAPYLPVDCGYQMTSSDLSSSVPYGLNIPQHLYLDADRRTHSLPASPRKLMKPSCMGAKDRLICMGEGVGEKTGKNKVLPKEAVTIMTEWLREHQENPYPNDDEKESLIASTKLTINQINYWFTNARRRILPKWALQRHLDEQEKARLASAGTYNDSRATSSPVS